MEQQTVTGDLIAIDSIDIPVDITKDTSRGRSWGFTPFWMLATMLSVPLVATIFWWLGTKFFSSTLTLFEYHQFSVVVAGVVAGGYQLYFWVQRNNLHVPAKCLKTPIDDWIPFWPGMIWCYSLLYFIMIGLTVISIRDLAQGVHLIFGGLLLLASGALIYYLYPTNVPGSYRDFQVNSLSTRYLAFIQSMDNDRNAFPSMHCAIAAYIGLTVTSLPTIGIWLGYGHIIIIAISCVTVKQHVFIDTLAGIVLGTSVFFANSWLDVMM
jgi:hypothetical protein